MKDEKCFVHFCQDIHNFVKLFIRDGKFVLEKLRKSFFDFFFLVFCCVTWFWRLMTFFLKIDDWKWDEKKTRQGSRFQKKISISHFHPKNCFYNFPMKK
jgi:hypothetical protein